MDDLKRAQPVEDGALDLRGDPRDSESEAALVGIVKHQRALAKYVVRPVLMAVEAPAVVPNVVSREHRQQHDIGIIVPNRGLQHQVLLRRAVAVDAEPQHLDSGHTSRHLCLHHLPEGFFQGHLPRFGEGISEHSYPQHAFGLGERMVRIAKPGLVDAQVRTAPEAIGAFHARSRRPAQHGMEPAELGKRDAGDAQRDLGDEQADEDTRTEEGEIAPPRPHGAVSRVLSDRPPTSLASIFRICSVSGSNESARCHWKRASSMRPTRQ